jgi:hypothetical protein
MSSTTRRLALLGALLLPAFGACAGLGSASTSAPGSSTGAGTGEGGFGPGAGTGGSVGEGADAGVSTGGAGGKPEVETESAFEVPVSTGKFVWVANPASGRVAYIDGTSLTVKTVEAGNAPTFLAPIPGTESVIVLNVLSNDATLLDAGGPTLTSKPIPSVAAGSNSWAVSPDGRWAIAWTDARRVNSPPRAQGFQDATVVDVKATDPKKTSTTLAVGFRPVSFSFSADSKQAFAVTQDGVSVIALGADGPTPSGTIALDDDPTADVDTRDVSITADGRLAMVRREGSSNVVAVDLGSGARVALPLSGPVTDLDVTSDGAEAVAVVRDTAEVAVIPLAGALPAAAAVKHLTITGETVGQVVLAANDTTAVLFSNATPAERITVVTLADPPSFRVVRLHAPVLSVFAAPDGKNAVVLHPTDDTGGGDGGVPPPGDGGASARGDGGALPSVDAGQAAPPSAGAFSLVPLDGTRTPRIETTDAPIQAVAVSPSSDRALITLRDDSKAVFAVYLGNFSTLVPVRRPLASPPVAAGVLLGAARGYVAQQHPDGRITFLTLDTGDPRTLTGYELASRVVDWSQP